MSLFSSLMRDFNEDPFFSSPMGSMRRMESMIDSMMNPFGGMFGAMDMHHAPIQDYGNARQQNIARQNGNMLMPFGFGRSLFPNMDDMFANFERMSHNPNSLSYSSSSVMTFSTDETGRPQVYQASSSTRQGPGGVKETRQTVQDSRSGLQKMAIGHHLNEKAHVVEKKKNKYTGEEEENHELVNLDDEEAEDFNQEWQRRAQSFQPRSMHAPVGYNNNARWRERSPPSQQRELLAITDGTSQLQELNSSARQINDASAGGKIHSSHQKHKRKHGSSSGHKSGHSHGRPTPYE